MSQREQYTKQKLYEEAFNVNYDWEKCLPPKCFQFHNLTCMETNAPISLQMGVMLPFVSACLGPTTRGCFMTRPSILNLTTSSVISVHILVLVSMRKYILNHK